MTRTDGAVAPRLDRLQTHVPGLDAVLAGGLVRGGIYLVGGRPGAGKTVFGNHLAHNCARRGGTVVFGTVMAETHDRMRAHLSGFDFFDASLMARRVHYVSLYDELHEGELERTLEVLRRLVREHRASLLVIDGANAFGDFAPSAVDYRQFIYRLQTQLAALGCTTVLLVDYDGRGDHPIAGHVDGIILLELDSVGLRDVRLLHVRKLRGVGYLAGRHPFVITSAGIEVFPRLEALLTGAQTEPAAQRRRLAFGIEGLDGMLRGGVMQDTTTLVLGSPGAGKTTTCLHFLIDGARRGERGLIATFHESPDRLIAKASAVGLDLGSYVDSGLVRILWHAPLELLLDAWNRDLLAAVEAHQPARFVIDGLTELQRLTAYPERLPAYLAALTSLLRARGATTLLSAEATTVVGAPLDLPIPTLAATVENAILLRYVELRSQLHRLISIIKTRESDYDTSIREFRITAHGLHVAASFESAEAVLTSLSGGGPEARTRPSRRARASTGRPTR